MSCSSERENPNPSQQVPTSYVVLSKEERDWMDKFFRDYFLEGSAIYTLFGTKPISQVLIISANEKERIESMMPHMQNMDEDEKTNVLKELQEYSQNYDLDKNWEKWIAWKKTQGPSPFLFAKRSSDSLMSSGYIINVREVIWSLQKHYALFSRELGQDFDPVEVALEFENLQSTFWDKVFASHLLQGILHGYGERNAYFFARQMDQSTTQEEQEKCCNLFKSEIVKNKEEGSLADLQLPSFRSYQLPYGEDPMIARYKREKEYIQEKLKGKDFIIEVINRIFDANDG